MSKTPDVRSDYEKAIESIDAAVAALEEITRKTRKWEIEVGRDDVSDRTHFLASRLRTLGSEVKDARRRRPR